MTGYAKDAAFTEGFLALSKVDGLSPREARAGLNLLLYGTVQSQVGRRRLHSTTGTTKGAPSQAGRSFDTALDRAAMSPRVVQQSSAESKPKHYIGVHPGRPSVRKIDGSELEQARLGPQDPLRDEGDSRAQRAVQPQGLREGVCTDGSRVQDSPAFETVCNGATEEMGRMVVKRKSRTGVRGAIISLGTMKPSGSSMTPSFSNPSPSPAWSFTRTAKRTSSLTESLSRPLS
ncbi:hypothetical protein DFH06DRAFT_1343134 [Mycena polygramma]|nr:hypothetical protein DFH06DRAFT_1343134 [Mycena polygramma]